MMKRLCFVLICIIILIGCNDINNTILNQSRYGVQYNGNRNTSGHAPIDNNQYLLGEEATVLDQGSLYKSGYVFRNWNTNQQGNGIAFNAGDRVQIVSGNITLFAIWDAGNDSGYNNNNDYGNGEVTVAELEITISSVTYSNNHQNRNAITPLENSNYSERTAYFTVAISGFTYDGNANNVGLMIQSVVGLSFNGHNHIGSASGGVKIFTVTVTYNGITEFATGSATINIIGLTNLSGTSYVYPRAEVSTTVYIIDGMATSRAIPVYQANIKHFNAFANTAGGLGRHYKLMQNIILPTVNAGQCNWTAIGQSSFNPFTGSFDGQGYTISNLTINLPGIVDQGMFGRISGSGAVVRNLGLLGGSVRGANFVGSIAGRVINGSIINCFSTGSVNGLHNIGGITGEVSNSGNIIESHSTGNVSGVGTVGGVAGSVNNSSITHSSSKGNIISSRDGRSGGVAGDTTNNSSISNSFSTGNVSSYREGSVGGDNTGGIVTVNNLRFRSFQQFDL